MRYKIIVEYKGTNYAGWQRQENALSVQEVIENALTQIIGEKITIHGSGRTDKGVHAIAQCAHFDAENMAIPANKLVIPLNALLPDDIKVKHCEIAPPDFHAQYSAKSKVYQYRFYVSQIISPLKTELSAQIIPEIDIDKMRKGAELLVGKHDFKSFCKAECADKNTVREILSLEIFEQGEYIILEIEGTGFLRNMVRIIAGTLVFLGKGQIEIGNIHRMLNEYDRTLGGKTFPSSGLFLKEVKY